MSLRPTHRCYDDAIDLIMAWLQEDGSIARGTDVLLVHGICTDSATQRQYAHAWVKKGNSVFTAALNEKNERIYIELEHDMFCQIFGVTEANHYSIAKMYEENAKHGTYGPWTEEHKKLTGPRGSLRKDAV